MAGDRIFMEHVMGLLDPVDGVMSRAMFGGYGIFHEGDMFALISDSRLYFKVSESNRDRFLEAGSEQFRSMPYYEVPTEVMEDRQAFLEWVEVSVAIGHATAKKRKK